MNALLANLQTKGLLDQTLVVVDTESGRAPRINDNDGRHQHDQAATFLLTGAGVGYAVAQEDTHSDNFEGTPWQAAVLNQHLMIASQSTSPGRGVRNPACQRLLAGDPYAVGTFRDSWSCEFENIQSA